MAENRSERSYFNSERMAFEGRYVGFRPRSLQGYNRLRNEIEVEKDDAICSYLNELDFDDGRIPRSRA